jgi:hypothetical protein
LARSRAGGRKTTTPGPAEALPPSSPPSLASATLPRVWQGVGYRLLPDVAAARPLFDFAAIPWPDSDVLFAWGAWRAAGPGGGAERLVGAVAAEGHARAVMLHGPVVVDDDGALEIAAQLVAAVLDHAAAAEADPVFTRPQGLDRVWVRFGFIPVPESTLPRRLAGRPGSGLYAWRGGSALWTLRESTSA